MTQLTAAEQAEAFVQMAQTYGHIEEKPRGSNWGPEVAEVLKSVGITVPAPWCAAWVYYVYSKTCAKHILQLKLPKTGHANTMFNLSAKFQITKAHYDVKTPRRGDIFILLLNPKTGAGHTGIVTAYDAKTRTYTTIEANTNDGGSREGYGVFERTRKLDAPELRGFIRIFE